MKAKGLYEGKGDTVTMFHDFVFPQNQKLPLPRKQLTTSPT
jgi:hypothetical protein